MGAAATSAASSGVGAAAGSYGGSPGVEVVLTDRDPAAVQLARTNIASNRRVLQGAIAGGPAGSLAVTVTAAEFDWDDADGARALLDGSGDGGGARGGGGGGGGRVAAVIAADVVYHEDSFAPLVHVLTELTKETNKETTSAAAQTTVPLVYLAYRQRCEPETAAHFFHMLDASFERQRVPWMWPFSETSASGPPPPRYNATLFSLIPRRRTEGGGGGGGGGAKSAPPCGYCNMLWEARARRLAVKGGCVKTT